MFCFFLYLIQNLHEPMQDLSISLHTGILILFILLFHPLSHLRHRFRAFRTKQARKDMPGAYHFPLLAHSLCGVLALGIDLAD